MQPLWLCLFSGRPFEESFENAQWTRMKQTNVTNVTLPLLRQAIWGGIWKRTVGKSKTHVINATLLPLIQVLWGSILKYTVETTKQMQSVWYKLLSSRQFEKTFENTPWRKSSKCNQCDFSCSDPSSLKRHLIIHSGEKSNKCNLI